MKDSLWLWPGTQLQSPEGRLVQRDLQYEQNHSNTSSGISPHPKPHFNSNPESSCAVHLSRDGRQRTWPAKCWYTTARFYCKIHSYLHCFYTHILRNPSAIITVRVITASKRYPLLLGSQDITRNDVVTLCVLGMTAAEWGQLYVESL